VSVVSDSDLFLHKTMLRPVNIKIFKQATVQQKLQMDFRQVFSVFRRR